MATHLVIDGNAFYEIDDECMKKKTEALKKRDKPRKRNPKKTKRKKRNPEKTKEQKRRAAFSESSPGSLKRSAGT